MIGSEKQVFDQEAIEGVFNPNKVIMFVRNMFVKEAAKK